MTSRLNFDENGSSDDEMGALIYSKDGEIFVFLYDDDDRLLETIGKSVANPESNLTWYDASILSQKYKRMKRSGIKKFTRAEIYEKLMKSFH